MPALVSSVPSDDGPLLRPPFVDPTILAFQALDATRAGDLRVAIARLALLALMLPAGADRASVLGTLEAVRAERARRRVVA